MCLVQGGGAGLVSLGLGGAEFNELAVEIGVAGGCCRHEKSSLLGVCREIHCESRMYGLSAFDSNPGVNSIS